MEDEIEDIVGDVKYSDSQKSVTASNVYSMDFTDSSSDKNNSSGKETYILELFDSEESDSYPIKEENSVISIQNYSPPITRMARIKDADVQCENNNVICKTASTSLTNCSVYAQEIFTQTSKTIFELAQTEYSGLDRPDRPFERRTLETQTSQVTITENKTVAYRIEYRNSVNHFETKVNISEENISNHIHSHTLDEESSRCPISDTDTVKSDGISEVSSDDRILNIINDESNENLVNDGVGELNKKGSYYNMQYETSSDMEGSNVSDIDDDSLMETRKSKTDISDTSEVPRSVDEDVEELYNRLSESIDIRIERPYETERQFSTLTPLTEESTIRRESLLDITPVNKFIPEEDDSDVLFTNNSGVKIKMLPSGTDTFKLPPIQISNRTNTSPHLNFLFSLQTPKHLPGMYEETGMSDRWEVGGKNLQGSGESPLISGNSDASQANIHLPPIRIEGYVVNSVVSNIDSQHSNQSKTAQSSNTHDSISINGKIKELKLCNKNGRWPRSRYTPTSDSRSGSPSRETQEDSRLYEITEKGCEALCAELVRRLRSASWFEVADTLEDIPKVLDKFWGVVAEFRIADLIRQIALHVDSPRTHVARAACATLAAVVKNTKYTKKPDFYEAVTLLLTKTGSFCQPVRRAANVALDDIVCGVEFTHAVTALCIHGVDHKSPLVRCAAGRLLVVCSALAGGGRGVLRARPPSAAHARAYVLRSLAALLDDKNTETRKYAERLYTMLRPLSNFEAYYLTDVDVETAARQMKKYDKLLDVKQAN